MKIKKKKIYVIAVITLLIILFRFFMFVPVKHALSYEEAKRMADSNDNYYIIAGIDCITASYFIINYGDLKGKGVIIEPELEDELSNAFFFVAHNEFLIKVKSIEKNHKEIEEWFNEECPIDYKIVMEDWEIIAPIERDYTYTFSERFNPPENHIDLLDVLFGDYKPKLLRNWLP